MSQCVPCWDLENNPSRVNIQAHSNSAHSDVPSLDYEQVAELTWKNGQVAMHGLGASRLVAPTKPAAPPTVYAAAWDKPRATGGTLESLVDQATSHQLHLKSALDNNTSAINVNELVPWFDHHRAAVAMAMDALVPCSKNSSSINTTTTTNNNNNNDQSNKESSARLTGPAPHVLGCSARVGSCSAVGSAVDGGGGARADSISRCGCASESATCGAGGREGRRHAPVDNGYRDRDFGGGGAPTSTSLWSAENTSSGGEYTRTSAEEHDSAYHSRSQAGSGDRKRKAIGKSAVPTKSRAAAIHNQSERKRRDKINQRMKTLQKMVPNSSKTDKASMLDEVIEYLKQLQAQVHMISRMNMAPSMMLPLAMQQQLQMSMMSAPMGMGIMDINAMGRAAGMQPVMPTPGGFMPVPSWDIHGNDRSQQPQLQQQAVMPDLMSAYLACQTQPNPMTMDAYSRMAALYQQFQIPPAPGSKN